MPVRYGRTVIISETGAEGSARASWLHYVVREVSAAIANGVQVDGICLFPITDYPGWADDRLCKTGLLGVADQAGRRDVYQPLLAELITSAEIMSEQRRRLFDRQTHSPLVRASTAQ